MTQSESLHSQVHNITDLSNALTLLLSDRSLCDSEITGELFFRYVDAVKDHLKNTESKVFAELLVNGNDHQNKIVDQFMDGSHEIKLIFSKYANKWCKNEQLRIKQFDDFYQETIEVFELVLRRVQDETENLYPLLQ